MGLQLSTRSEVPHGLTSFHAKQSLMQTYVSSFLIVESSRRREFTTSMHTLYNAKRGSMGLHGSTTSRRAYVKIAIIIHLVT